MTPELKRRESVAINLFITITKSSYAFADPFYKITDSNGLTQAYAVVIPVFKMMYNAYPLPITVSQLSRLADKRIKPIVIWSCDDGIIYTQIDKLNGAVRMGGDPHKPTELHCYYEKQKGIRYVKHK